MSYFDDDVSESAKEISTRARRTRKSEGQEGQPRLDRQTSKENWRESKDDVSKKVSHDSTLKRRNTGKKIDADKV